MTSSVVRSGLTETKIESTLPGGGYAVRVGPFAADQSYWQLYVSYAGLNVSISATGGTGPLNLLVEPLGCAGAAGTEVAGGAAAPEALNCSDFALVISPRYVWFRAGT